MASRLLVTRFSIASSSSSLSASIEGSSGATSSVSEMPRRVELRPRDIRDTRESSGTDLGRRAVSGRRGVVEQRPHDRGDLADLFLDDLRAVGRSGDRPTASSCSICT